MEASVRIPASAFVEAGLLIQSSSVEACGRVQASVFMEAGTIVKAAGRMETRVQVQPCAGVEAQAFRARMEAKGIRTLVEAKGIRTLVEAKAVRARMEAKGIGTLVEAGIQARSEAWKAVQAQEQTLITACYCIRPNMFC